MRLSVSNAPCGSERRAISAANETLVRGWACAIRSIAAQRTVPTMNTARGRRRMLSSILRGHGGNGVGSIFLAIRQKIRPDPISIEFSRAKEHLGAVRPLLAGIVLAAALPVTGSHPAADDLIDTLDRIGDRVAQYYSTAQSIVALETVRIQPETRSMMPEGFARVLVYDLRVDWTPPLDVDHPGQANV